MTLEQLCHNIKVRMREIDSDITCADDSKSRPPTGDDYNRLWDALWDELRAAGQPFMEEWPPVRPGYPTGVPCWLLLWQEQKHMEANQRARKAAQQRLRRIAAGNPVDATTPWPGSTRLAQARGAALGKAIESVVLVQPMSHSAWNAAVDREVEAMMKPHAMFHAIANSVGAEHFGEVADDESRFDDD